MAMNARGEKGKHVFSDSVRVNRAAAQQHSVINSVLFITNMSFAGFVFQLVLRFGLNGWRHIFRAPLFSSPNSFLPLLLSSFSLSTLLISPPAPAHQILSSRYLRVHITFWHSSESSGFSLTFSRDSAMNCWTLLEELIQLSHDNSGCCYNSQANLCCSVNTFKTTELSERALFWIIWINSPLFKMSPSWMVSEVLV